MKEIISRNVNIFRNKIHMCMYTCVVLLCFIVSDVIVNGNELL